MCGILALFDGRRNESGEKKSVDRQHFVNLSKRIRHRGPDWSGIWINNDNTAVISHERLSIVGVESGSQPIHIEKYGIVLSVNGEIYNYKSLYSNILYNKYKPVTKSDCEVIIYLYLEYGAECVKMLDGIFGFVLYDTTTDTILVARDPIGIIPLYYGGTEDGQLYVCSEMKGIHDQCSNDRLHLFPPSTYMVCQLSHTSKLWESEHSSMFFTNYFSKEWKQSPSLIDTGDIPSKSSSINDLMNKIRTDLTSSVKKRLMTEVPFGVLLSGGLDSSLICSITNKLMQSKENSQSWGSKLHSFSIGLKGAPDLKYAKMVADFCGTIHHEYNFTVQEGIDAIRDLIYHLETYDVTTIRASTPMYLMSRLIKSNGIKMVLSGEGADEILGGYLYFHNAPDAEQFHEECLKRVAALSNFDCLRANKSTMAWGLEARVPFLDRALLQTLMPIHADLKLGCDHLGERKIEKYILRKAFCETVCGEKYLPDEILWRQKEQFSDGVGYNWIDGLKEFIDTQISEEEFNTAVASMKECGEEDIPRTTEALYFRRIFDELFPGRSNIVPRWVPRIDWEGVSYDPSGRAQGVHNNTTISNV